MFDKLKKLAEDAKEKAGPLAEQARDRAAELAEEAKVKAGPLAEQARERATELAGKAAPAVSQGVDRAAESIDKATGGRFTEQLDKGKAVVHDTAGKVADRAGGTGTPSADAPGSAAASTPDPSVDSSTVVGTVPVVDGAADVNAAGAEPSVDPGPASSSPRPDPSTGSSSTEHTGEHSG